MKQIESIQKTINSQHATIIQVNRNSQKQLKEIRGLKRDGKSRKRQELKSVSVIPSKE